MSNKNKLIGMFIFMILLIISTFFFKPIKSPESFHETTLANTSPNTSFTPTDTKSEKISEKPIAVHASVENDSKNVLMLNAENFEASSEECFTNASCEIEGDPWKVYLAIKEGSPRNVSDLYIAFLRKKLTDQKFKEQYKDILIKMIKDFYPADQIDFQMAAYYNYLGDLDSSLQAYLELEKKAKADPKLYTAPKLNIANTYYDLGRYKEALVYYKASLNDLKSTETSDMSGSITFINERIETIKDKLSH